MTHWTVYSRADCSLCDELLDGLVQLVGPTARIDVVDIGGNPGLELRYGQRVPVLLADGEFVCAYRLDAQRVRRYLEPI